MNEIDTYGQSIFEGTPSEAINFNGKFLEDMIPGYRTLNVQGRELFGSEENYVQLGIRDGQSHIYSRFPEREIVVQYYLKADSNESFRDTFNRLNMALFTEKEVEFWFNDEPEMFFIGKKTKVEDVDPGVNWAISSFTLKCGDPYKYTKSDATSVVWGSNSITFQANYLMGNTGSGAVNLRIKFEGGAFWGSDLITFQHQGYLMGDKGIAAQPYEIYPTVEGLKVKPTITIIGTGRGVKIRTRNDTVDLGDFDYSTIIINTKNFHITKNGRAMIRPMNDFYIYPSEPLYVEAREGNIQLTIEYPNRFL
ncbi:distal tail protein Dit [Enterococcus sp. AZ103]|uniref:distal tail protein Dit n=1 Tax=Enterococcus sp. AZ103 TaxID=2774628 RepID=UPI003F258F07